MNICNSLKYGSQILRKNNFNSALIDSELLMGGILNQERIKFLLNLQINTLYTKHIKQNLVILLESP